MSYQLNLKYHVKMVYLCSLQETRNNPINKTVLDKASERWGSSSLGGWH
jgi:hypothetical protein